MKINLYIGRFIYARFRHHRRSGLLPRGPTVWIIRSGEIECYHAIGTYFIAKGLFILFITESKEKKNQKTG